MLAGTGMATRFLRIKIRGAPKTNRTSDLPLRRGLLYPLSYRGVRRHFNVKYALFPEGNPMLKWLLIAFVIGVALLLWRITAHANRNLPKTGDAAPDFKLPDQHGTLRTKDEFRGKWLVLYFYPRDDTPGCTVQAACFRDGMRELEAAGAVVCGISVDDSASHAAFARKYKLPFALLADRLGETAARYGSLRDFGFFKFAKRNTFLIDPQGKVTKVYLSVNPARNSSDVANDLRGMVKS
jgi:thioredoxin-dependent peroxiredoxin